MLYRTTYVRSFVALFACVTLMLVGGETASASVLPEKVSGMSAVVTDDSAVQPTIGLSWLASNDPDGTVAGYLVQYYIGAASAAVDIGQVGSLSVVIGPVRRGFTYRLRVVALDDSGDQSAPTELSLEVPLLASSARLVQVDGGVRKTCSKPCTRVSVASTSLEISALSHARAQIGRPVSVQLWHRTPGAVRLRSAGELLGQLGSDGKVNIPLKRSVVARRSGLWCMQATITASADFTTGKTARSCLRFRPPVMLGWSGDMTLGSSYGHPPAGGSRLFSAVDDLLRQPALMIGNYEGTLSYGGTSRCSGGPLCFIFQAPPSRAKVLDRAGYDVLNLANNHGLDKGLSGRNQTIAALKKVGIPAAGLPHKVTVVQVEDTKVAIVGISPYPGLLPMTPPVVSAQVAAAKRRGDVVVVLMHAGLEGARGAHVPRGSDNNAQTYAATHAAVDAGADVVFGSGPHVVRGVERYRGRYIIYSSGNFAGWHNFALNRLTSQSGIIHVSMTYDGHATTARWHGVRLSGPGIPVRDRSVVRRVAALSRADFGRRGARFSRGGTFR